jgi:hypothetical protein
MKTTPKEIAEIIIGIGKPTPRVGMPWSGVVIIFGMRTNR